MLLLLLLDPPIIIREERGEVSCFFTTLEVTTAVSVNMGHGVVGNWKEQKEPTHNALVFVSKENADTALRHSYWQAHHTFDTLIHSNITITITINNNIMSKTPSIKSTALSSTQSRQEEEEEDFGVLIYREWQRRKAEAAAAAAAAAAATKSTKKRTSASTTRRTSTRKKPAATNRVTVSTESPRSNSSTKRKRES